MSQSNAEADADPAVLRISLDAKATVKVGPFARGGKSRVAVQAADHDFKPAATVTPVGLFLPATDELFIYQVTSKVTSDCLVDRLEQWWTAHKARFAHVTTLLLNLDNGPENHSRRSQFMARLLRFVQQQGVRVRLAYYPPYHSKYNPIERCWGILENHWNGALLDSLRRGLWLHADDDLEGRASGSGVGNHTLYGRCQAHQRRDGGRGSPAHAAAPLGEVVCGHRLPLSR